jgi:hypothetical protein
VGVAVCDRLCGGAVGGSGQWCRGGVVVDGLQLCKGLVGGGGLLVAVAGGAPALDGDDGEDRRVEEHREPGAVASVGLPRVAVSTPEPCPQRRSGSETVGPGGAPARVAIRSLSSGVGRGPTSTPPRSPQSRLTERNFTL